MAESSKEPVLLVVLIDTAPLRWFVAGVTTGGKAIPLMRSEEENLAEYVGKPLEEQVTFLRHRLAGVLQRGCDRLWARQLKPRQIIFVADAPFPDAAPELTPAVAEHFAAWMVSPPATFLVADAGFTPQADPSFNKIAGELDPADAAILEKGLGDLYRALAHSEAWELSQGKQGGP